MQFHAIPCQVIGCIQLIWQLPTAINCCIKMTCLWYVNRHDIVEWNCARGVTFFVLAISHYFIRWKIWNSVSRRTILLGRLTFFWKKKQNRTTATACKQVFFLRHHMCCQFVRCKLWFETKYQYKTLDGKKLVLCFEWPIQRVWSSVRKSMICIERTKRKTNQVKQDGWKGAMEFELTQFKVIDLLTWWHYFTHSGKWQRWIWPDHGRYVELKPMAFT